jgi:hypothetical protein
MFAQSLLHFHFFDISASFTTFFAASFFLWFVSAGLLTVLWALAIGLLGNFILRNFNLNIV